MEKPTSDQQTKKKKTKLNMGQMNVSNKDKKKRKKNEIEFMAVQQSTSTVFNRTCTNDWIAMT